MNEYHKIQSIYLRDPETKHKRFLIGQWTLPEFEYLADNEWSFTEKVDGTNIRIYWRISHPVVLEQIYEIKVREVTNEKAN